MFSFLSNIPSLFNPGSHNTDEGKRIRVESVHIHDVEASDEKSSQTLKHLLKLNHTNFAILFHDNEFHNHLPHILGSAFLLGADSDKLNIIYTEDSASYVPWVDSPGEISTHDWRDYFGDTRYLRAYLDFFEDQLVSKGYSWRDVIEEYLYAGPEPLFNSLICGLGHPLIHLGYAYELSSRDVAMEALTMAATCYSPLHKYLDDPSYTRPSPFKDRSPLNLLLRISADERLNAIVTEANPANGDMLVKDHEEIVLEYWNALEITDPTKQFEDSQLAATAIVVATHNKSGPQYDFFLLHILTTSHAVRILLPVIPPQHHVAFFRQWWLLAVLTYMSQAQPKINLDSVSNVDLQGKDWSWVDKQALEGKHATEEHFVKGLRAMKEAARTWGDKNHFHLKAAVRLALEYDGWGGFGSEDTRTVDPN